MKFLTRNDIQERMSISKSQFYKVREMPDFPEPVEFPRGSRCKRYLASEFDSFIEKQLGVRAKCEFANS